MTRTFANSQQFPAGIFITALLIAFVFGLIWCAMPDVSHAFLRHGEESNLGRECQGKGTLFFNPTTNRFGNVCMTSGGFFGVWISESGREITSFVKNKMKTWEQINKYMENAGYHIVQ